MDFVKGLLIFGWLFVILWIPFIIYQNRNLHPRALFILFFAEMWERFSYYGMRALLTLYMVQVLFVDMGAQMAEAKAYAVYGSYTAMVYLFPVVGGMLADQYLGFRKAIIFGGIVMVLGHVVLGLSGLPSLEDNRFVFYVALALIILGNGYFKPNISSFLGEFYEKDDPRKDGAFSIFYMGVNTGAFLSMMTCSYVGQNYSWHWGFGLAAIGMLLGVIVFYLNGSYFGERGLAPKEVRSGERKLFGLPPFQFVLIATTLMVPVVAYFLELDATVSLILVVLSFGILIFLYLESLKEPEETRKRLWVVCILYFFHSIFWALFEQAGGSLTIFAEKYVDRSILGSIFPSGQMQAFNPLYILLFAPVFSWLWLKLRSSGNEPSTPMKFVLGLAQLALGFLIIYLGATYFLNEDGKVPMIFIALMYLFHTTGELSISPVGLSLVTKLSPGRIVGFVMGAWFLSIALANKVAGLLGQLTATTTDADISSYSTPYFVWGVCVVLGSAVLLFLLVPTLRKWMKGIH